MTQNAPGFGEAMQVPLDPPRAPDRRYPALPFDLRLRVQELERLSMFGLCAYIVLGDLLNNVRSSGGLTGQLVETTFAELLDHLRSTSPDGQHPMTRHVEAMMLGTAIE